MHCIAVRGGSGSFASCGIAHAPAGEPLSLEATGSAGQAENQASRRRHLAWFSALSTSIG
jgi:hypothetical protein